MNKTPTTRPGPARSLRRTTGLLVAGVLASLLVLGGVPVPAAGDDAADYRAWIEAMKSNPRGPFKRLRWFCNDGAILPPKAYACRGHGGGHQHGQYSDRTKTLRAEGYQVANLFAGVDGEALLASPDFADTLGQMLVERYLISADNGWIFRRALFYRGAIQEEDEREGARDVLEAMAGSEAWSDRGFLALRTAAQLLPHGGQSASAQAIRQESAALSDVDEAFMPVRAKIHGAPDAGDAERVRRYAANVDDEALEARYLALAEQIDAVYQARPLAEVLAAVRPRLARALPELGEAVDHAAARLAQDAGPAERHGASAELLAALRAAFPRADGARARLAILDASLELEAAHLRAGTELRPRLPQLKRSEQLSLLDAAARAAYGAGLLKRRELDALTASLAALDGTRVALDDYLAALRYFGRVPGWASQNLRFFFFDSMQKLADIEPKAMLFIQDQLRGSPLLFFSGVLDGLLQDGNRLAGVEHRLFGETLGAGFNALNPGIAVGELRVGVEAEDIEDLEPDGIYVLPETVSDLPPIAGILTAGEGNPLSHVQLLARNLGIPNVAVDEALLPRLAARDGVPTVLAVSPAGLVELARFDDAWEERLGREQEAGGVVIRPDLDKLDLSERRFLDLDVLRASDSGVTVGPKAAKLGELRSAFPEAVAPGLAIPFGLFEAEVLDRPYDSERTIFEWMVARYRDLEALPEGSEERAEQTERFRAELYDRILEAEPSDDFRERLRRAMREAFGGTDVGVFVRSDTNVEDLPGFTGAGLNLTLPNVVGFDALIEAINRVWASPFTARAFAWRQSHMETPEHVYTSILLLESVASEKSGVLVTQDLDTGDRAVLSVAVNEGVGGAVDGQAAESLRIDTRDGSVRVMATATAPWRRRPAAGGGIERLPASGDDAVLRPEEIERLIVFARDELPERFPPITDDQGAPAAADIEFGFVDGELRLFQLRPFLESRSARGNAILVDMDRALEGNLDRRVDLTEVPQP